MDSKKSINSFNIKKDRLPNYLLNNFSYQFVKAGVEDPALGQMSNFFASVFYM